MNKTYLIKVRNVNDDRIILGILDYGTIDATLKHLNTFIVTAEDHAKSELTKSYGVLKVEEDEKFIILCK